MQSKEVFLSYREKGPTALTQPGQFQSENGTCVESQICVIAKNTITVHVIVIPFSVTDKSIQHFQATTRVHVQTRAFIVNLPRPSQMLLR